MWFMVSKIKQRTSKSMWYLGWLLASVTKAASGKNKQRRCHCPIVYTCEFYLACEDLSSQRTPITHHRNAIAKPLWVTGPLGILGYYQPMSLVLPFTFRLANPRWVIYLFLHGRIYRHSLLASGGKMVSVSFPGEVSNQHTCNLFRNGFRCCIR